MISLIPPLSLRQKTGSDESYLRALFKSSREHEFASVHWPSPLQEEVFYADQFNAQVSHFNTTYETLDYGIIELQDSPIGRLIVDWQPLNMHLVDFILLPEHQRKGYGRQILNALLNEVDQKKLTASVHFEKSKPHMQSLYENHGFVLTRELELHWFMERDSREVS